MAGVRGGDERGRGISNDGNNGVTGFRTRLRVDSNSFPSKSLSGAKLLPWDTWERVGYSIAAEDMDVPGMQTATQWSFKYPQTKTEREAEVRNRSRRLHRLEARRTMICDKLNRHTGSRKIRSKLYLTMSGQGK